MKLFQIPFLAGAILSSFLGTGAAATIPLEDVISTTLRKNADLAAARLTIEEARGRLTQSGRLSNPDFEGEFKPQINGEGQGAQGILAFGVMQRFPLTARLRREREVSQAELAVAVAEVRDAERRLAGEAMLAAVNWLSLEEQISLKKRQQANSRDLATASSQSAAAGESSALDAAQFEFETQEIATQMLQFESQRAELMGQLRTLLGVASPESIEIVGTLRPVEKAEDAEMTLALRPDYQAALARRETSEYVLALARANRWQDIGVGVFGELERVDDRPVGVVQDNFVGLRISVPLPLWNRNEGRIQESAASVQRAEQESAALAFRIRNEVDVAQQQMLAAATLDAELGKALLPRARDLEDRLGRMRTEGSASSTDVLRARERRLRIESARVEAQRDFDRARVRLDTATGKILSNPPTP